MIKTSEEIKQIYMNAYPDLESHYAIPFSPKILIPKTFSEIYQRLKKHSVIGISHIRNIRDCELRAWKVSTDMHWERALKAEQLPKEKQYRESFGWITGYKMPFRTEHTIITTYSQDRGIVNIDPLTDEIQEVDLNKFNALLLVM